jgi:hypothetical protein
MEIFMGYLYICRLIVNINYVRYIMIYPPGNIHKTMENPSHQIDG